MKLRHRLELFADIILHPLGPLCISFGPGFLTWVSLFRIKRSMAASKDTEIAMGSYQPHHSWAEEKHPHGQIYGYRMSLWAEHLGMLDKCFEEPWSLKCVKRVNETAVDNWQRFTSENFTTLQGHLLKYPIQVSADGQVDPLPGHENFPDFGAKVLGAYSLKLPDVLTT